MTNIIKQNSFESGNPSGTAMTAGSGGNTGGSAGDFLANVFAASGAGALFSSGAHRGALAGLARLVAATGATFGFRTTALGHADIYIRGVFKVDVLPPATLFLITARDNALNGSGFSVRLTTAGALHVYKRSTTAAILGTLATNITVGNWYRIDVHFTAAGVWELRVYNLSANSWTQLADVITGTGVATALTFFDYVNFGGELLSGTGTLDALWDDIAYGSDWIGPVASADARPIENTGSVNMTAVGKPSNRECTSDGSDSTYAESGTLSGTASYTEGRLSALGSGSVKYRSRVAADSTPGVDATINLYQGTTLVATHTETDIPTTPTTFEYTLTGGEEALITDRENLRVRTSFTV